MRLILLGSGAVRPDLERWGPGQVVQVGNENLLFDCGRGATMRLVQAGIAPETISRVFFTHHHFDHNCDFAYFFLISWSTNARFLPPYSNASIGANSTRLQRNWDAGPGNAA